MQLAPGVAYVTCYILRLDDDNRILYHYRYHDQLHLQSNFQYNICHNRVDKFHLILCGMWDVNRKWGQITRLPSSSKQV